MPNDLTISSYPENLEFGEAEEQATFGRLEITVNDRLLTQGVDADTAMVRAGPFVPSYPVAEWLICNWWRLRWEFGRPNCGGATHDWDCAHRMSTVGDGYVWPNVTVVSDGVNASFTSDATADPEQVLFRFLGAREREDVTLCTFETAIDEFVCRVISRLDAVGLTETNLHKLWDNLSRERTDPNYAQFRKLEAILGHDPDGADQDAILGRLRDATRLGEQAIAELAADASIGNDPLARMMWATDISEIAESRGFDADLRDGFTITDTPQPDHVTPAWMVGTALAKTVRQQAHLNGESLNNDRLAELVGIARSSLKHARPHSHAISFSLATNCPTHARIALGSRHVTGQRFALARLLGDRLAGCQPDAACETLAPATRSESYRQKTQRAFAAELLCPYEAIDDMLDGDLSQDKQGEVATYFKVSPLVVYVQLVNHGRLRVEDVH